MLIIKRIKYNHFNNININDMSLIFCGCSSLEKLNLGNFNTNNVTDMIIIKIKAQYKNIKEKAFKN